MNRLLVLALLTFTMVGAAPVLSDDAPTPSIEIVIVRPPDGSVPYVPVFSEARLRRDLRPILESGCDQTSIENTLSRRYKFLGYVPTIEVSCSSDAVRVQVRESSHIIRLITFDPSELTRVGVKPDPDFEERHQLYPVPPDAPRAVLRSLLLTQEGDLYNFERYRSDSEALARLGYTAAFIPGSPADGPGYADAAYLLQSLTPRAAGTSSNRKTNYIGGTASYGPRQKGLAGLLYEKDDLFGDLDRLTFAPTYSSSAGGTLAYSAPLLARREAPRFLFDFETSLFSEFLHNRQLDAVETDQRRSGVSGTVGFRPLHLAAPHSLRFEIGLRDERIELEQAPPGEEDGSTDSVQAGVTYDWRHTDRSPSLSAHLAQKTDIVVRARGGERTFVRPGLEATLHARFQSSVEIDVHFAGGTIDREVPSFEMWTLGGPTTVRGFREDSFLGRHLAALQAEVWLPFLRPQPIVLPPEDAPDGAAGTRFEPRAARLFKWALFADGGYLSGTTQGTTESIAGAGLGIRFLVPRHPFVVKFDYGWGLGARGGDAFPYMALAYRY